MKQRESDIPQDAVEWLVREYSQQGQLTYFRLMDCMFHDQLVGQRAYDNHGKLIIETPLKDGKKHGREYRWNEEGALESVEPYFEGKLHGLSRQYGRKGNVIGTYRCVHGTGFDVWRQEKEDGTVFVSEIHSLNDGFPHGYEWWLGVDQHTVWQERHWREGQLHGIERFWNNKSRLHRGYPKFWIQGQAVSKRTYLKAIEQDKTLPPFRAEDNRPERQFPVDIEELLAK